MERIKILFIVSYLYLVIGAGMNITALRENNGSMPVLDANSNLYWLTDIYKLPFTNYYFSLGDTFAFCSLMLFYITIFKKDFLNKR